MEITMNSPVHSVRWNDHLRQSVDRTLAGAIEQIEAPALRDIIEQSTAGGKRIRPLLTILACAAAGGREEDALPAAAALELLHASSLVHDDIMDNALLRRGMPAVHVMHGMPMAILAGDALIALSYRTLQMTKARSTAEILSTFSLCFLQLCEGQCADIRFTNTEGVSHDPSHHRWMVERKTARLLEACMRIGALVATDDRRVVDALGNFGLHLGLAYQAMDDLLDATGHESGTGKSVGMDVQNGRQTYLTLACRSSNQFTATWSVVTDHTTEALMALDAVPASIACDRLRDLAHLLLARQG